MSKLSDTVRGQIWLKQFEEKDSILAKLLLDSILLVSTTDLEQFITSQIEKISQLYNAPIALYTVSELPDDALNSEGNIIKDAFEIFCNSDNGGIFEPIQNQKDIGSEGRISSIIRNIANESQNRILNHPTLDAFIPKDKSDEKVEVAGEDSDSKEIVKTIVFIDDLCGSGDQISDYIKAFHFNKRIKSRVSSNHLKFVVLAYSVTEDAKKALDSIKCKSEIIYEKTCPTIYTLPVRNITQRKIHDLIDKYTPSYLGALAYGYKETGALIAFQYRTPDNLPAIFICGENIDNWKSMFPNRSVDGETQKYFKLSKNKVNFEFLAEELGNKTLRRKLNGAFFQDETTKNALSALLLARGANLKLSVFEQTFDGNVNEAETFLNEMVRNELISESYKITKIGLNILKRLQSIDTLLKKGYRDLISEEDYYYMDSVKSSGHS